MANIKRKLSSFANDSPLLHKHRRKRTKIEVANKLPIHQFQERYLPLSLLDPNLNHADNGHHLKLEFKSASELNAEELRQCLRLIESTSRHDYERSSLGWHPRHKTREMTEPEMRYLLVHCTSPECHARAQDHDGNKPIDGDDTNDDDDGDSVQQSPGFMSFMLTHDSTPAVPVLYIYEIHLSEPHRKQGMGRHLMRAAEAVAAKVGLEKVMLTCFLANRAAHGFYASLGYEADACSPTARKTRTKLVEPDYVIMSKAVPSSHDLDGFDVKLAGDAGVSSVDAG